MKRKRNKDLAVLYILEILMRFTDYDNPILYRDVEEMLRDEYGIEFSRHTVEAKINALIEGEFAVRKGAKSGAYYDNRAFEEEELNLLIYSVMANKNISYGQAKSMADRISELGGDLFRPMGKVEKDGARRSGGNQELFMNLEEIHTAIRRHSMISFDYCRYGTDKKLHMSETHDASPYYVAMKNQNLYMMAYSEKYADISFFRIDKMMNIQPLARKSVDIRTLPGHERGLDQEYRNYISSALPYMFSDEPVQIAFRADESMTDNIVDWFGQEVMFGEDPEDGSKVIANVKSSPMAMEYWAKQYLDSVEVIMPVSLRDRIRDSLRSGIEKYDNKEKDNRKKADRKKGKEEA